MCKVTRLLWAVLVCYFIVSDVENLTVTHVNLSESRSIFVFDESASITVYAKVHWSSVLAE